MYEYYSVFNSQFMINQSRAVVALLRKPNGKNNDHVFIIVERLNGFNKINFDLHQLFFDEENHKCSIDIRNIVEKPEDAGDALAKKLLNREDIVGKCWSISNEDALNLHNNILNSQRNMQINPENYNIYGENASIPYSGDIVRESAPQSAELTSDAIEKSSDKLCGGTPTIVKEALSPSGKNCFTWARAMLWSINDAQIKKDIPRSPIDLIGALPSYYLPKAKSCCII